MTNNLLSHSATPIVLHSNTSSQLQCGIFRGKTETLPLSQFVSFDHLCKSTMIRFLTYGRRVPHAFLPCLRLFSCLFIRSPRPLFVPLPLQTNQPSFQGGWEPSFNKGEGVMTPPPLPLDSHLSGLKLEMHVTGGQVITCDNLLSSIFFNQLENYSTQSHW